jgi:hypothetical protein
VGFRFLFRVLVTSSLIRVCGERRSCSRGGVCRIVLVDRAGVRSGPRPGRLFPRRRGVAGGFWWRVGRLGFAVKEELLPGAVFCRIFCLLSLGET